MKHLILILFATINCVVFNSCNETTDKKLIAECPGNWNMTLKRAEAEKMIIKYRSLYGTGKPNLADSIWIDALVIRSLGAFFESPKGKGFDGVRFFNGAPSGNNESILIMVPTKAVPDTNIHENIWGDGIFSLIEPTPVRFQHFNKKYAEFAKEHIERFDTLYRENGVVDALSKTIWINRCVFTELKRLMDLSLQTSDEITGISVLFGAYENFIPEVSGQKYKNQSTIIIVPTSSDGVQGHSNRWDIIKEKIKKLDDAGYNHGELCPNKCD